MTEPEQKQIHDKLDSFIDEVRGYRKEFQEHIEEIKPVLEFVRTLSFSRKILIWVCVTITSVGAAIFTIKKLF